MAAAKAKAKAKPAEKKTAAKKTAAKKTAVKKSPTAAKAAKATKSVKKPVTITLRNLGDALAGHSLGRQQRVRLAGRPECVGGRLRLVLGDDEY